MEHVKKRGIARSDFRDTTLRLMGLENRGKHGRGCVGRYLDFDLFRQATVDETDRAALAARVPSSFRRFSPVDMRRCRRRHSSCPVVLPHEGMLLVGSLSFWLLFFHLHGRRRWACGRRLRRWATRPRSGALSMAATGAPQAHRPHAHGLPGAKRPSPSAALKFRVWVTLRLVLAQTCVGCP